MSFKRFLNFHQKHLEDANIFGAIDEILDTFFLTSLYDKESGLAVQDLLSYLPPSPSSLPALSSTGEVNISVNGIGDEDDTAIYDKVCGWDILISKLHNHYMNHFKGSKLWYNINESDLDSSSSKRKQKRSLKDNESTNNMHDYYYSPYHQYQSEKLYFRSQEEENVLDWDNHKKTRLLLPENPYQKLTSLLKIIESDFLLNEYDDNELYDHILSEHDEAMYDLTFMEENALSCYQSLDNDNDIGNGDISQENAKDQNEPNEEQKKKKITFTLNPLSS